MHIRPWFERSFPYPIDPGSFAGIVERLAGTASRIEEKCLGLDAFLLTQKPGGTWSINEHVGHLGDLEPLWLGRILDLKNGHEKLRDADLTNRTTHEAGHNQTGLLELSRTFRQARASFVNELEDLSEKDLSNTALHPRLLKPMTIVDLCYFVAEHDDHHLAHITKLIREIPGSLEI